MIFKLSLEYSPSGGLKKAGLTPIISLRASFNLVSSSVNSSSDKWVIPAGWEKVWLAITCPLLNSLLINFYLLLYNYYIIINININIKYIIVKLKLK